MTFLEIVLDLIQKKGITKNKMLTDLGINKNAFVSWGNRGNIPSGEVLVKIADYFGVSTDYLLGRTADESGPTTAADDEATLNRELIRRLCDLTSEELEKVDAFVQGLLAAR